MSTRKPCSWSTLLRPPGRACFSMTVTSNPSLRSRSAAASPPIPAPMMMTDFMIDSSSLQPAHRLPNQGSFLPGRLSLRRQAHRTQGDVQRQQQCDRIQRDQISRNPEAQIRDAPRRTARRTTPTSGEASISAGTGAPTSRQQQHAEPAAERRSPARATSRRERQQPIPKTRKEVLAESLEDLARVLIHPAADILRRVGQPPAEALRLDPPAQRDVVDGIAAHGRVAADLRVGARGGTACTGRWSAEKAGDEVR